MIYDDIGKRDTTTRDTLLGHTHAGFNPSNRGGKSVNLELDFQSKTENCAVVLATFVTPPDVRSPSVRFLLVFQGWPAQC
jgi:hypothetical protein